MATYYIDQNAGSDSNAGTAPGSGHAWKTISKCYSAAANGDTINMANNGNFACYSGNPSIGLNFIGPSATNRAVVDGTGISNPTWRGAGSYTETMTNIIFQNITTNNIMFCGYGGTQINSFTNCVFNNLVGTNTGGAGSAPFFSASTTTTVNITGCLMYGMSQGGGAFFNLFSYMTGGPINITNSVFYFNTVVSNIFDQTFGSGGSTITLKNNIWKNDATSIVWTNGSADTFVTSYNDYNGTYGSLLTLGTGDITVDPLFVDVSSGNFNLRPTSPCIDTGHL